MGIRISQHGNFNKLERFLKKVSDTDYLSRFAKYGEMGLEALKSATPERSGLTAASWGYSLEVNGSGVRIVWTNSNINQGVPISIIIDTGHGTGTGGYVAGREYIDPAIVPVFDQIINEMWKELTG